MDLDLVYEDSWELSNAFDDYVIENEIELSSHWMSIAEHWSIDEFADVMEENNLQTIRSCIEYFC